MAYYYDLSFDETLKHHQTRDKKLEFGEKEMRRWWIGKELLSQINEYIFDKNISIDSALQIIFNHLQKDIAITKDSL